MLQAKNLEILLNNTTSIMSDNLPFDFIISIEQNAITTIGKSIDIYSEFKLYLNHNWTKGAIKIDSKELQSKLFNNFKSFENITLNIDENTLTIKSYNKEIKINGQYIPDVYLIKPVQLFHQIEKSPHTLNKQNILDKLYTIVTHSIDKTYNHITVPLWIRPHMLYNAYFDNKVLMECIEKLPGAFIQLNIKTYYDIAEDDYDSDPELTPMTCVIELIGEDKEHKGIYLLFPELNLQIEHKLPNSIALKDVIL